MTLIVMLTFFQSQIINKSGQALGPTCDALAFRLFNDNVLLTSTLFFLFTENHRTQTQYNDALIIKLFAFQFVNNYASCFYIAFFRGVGLTCMFLCLQNLTDCTLNNFN